TQNVIDYELPVLNKQKQVDLVTLLIGVNDWVRGVNPTEFHKNLNFIIDNVLMKLSNKKNLVLITIPDFGVTPQGKLYAGERNITKGISEFNIIIKSEAKKRNLICIDIFSTTQKMKNDKSLIAS